MSPVFPQIFTSTDGNLNGKENGSYNLGLRAWGLRFQLWGLRFGVSVITLRIENQIKEKMENEMEVGCLWQVVTYIIFIELHNPH